MDRLPESKVIYLTFDDGIEPGTAEVLTVLRRQQVKATFFLTGINTLYSMEQDKKSTLESIEEITAHHVAANHSFSHGNGFYNSYYTRGLLIDNKGGRMSVLDDFLRNELFFQQTLPHQGLFNFKNLARLPGRNADLTFGSASAKANLFEADKDADNARLTLAEAGYTVWGWNEEWRMDYTVTNRITEEKQLRIDRGEIDYTDFRQMYPAFADYGVKYPNEERLIERWPILARRIITRAIQNDMVLLMHDRSFRPGDENAAQEDLELLIIYLKKNGFIFKTLNCR